LSSELWELEQAAGLDPSLVGSKAQHLGRLRDQGYSVPPGVVIPTTIMRTLLEAHGCPGSGHLGEEREARRIREVLLGAPLPPYIGDSLARALSSWFDRGGTGDGMIIVRSSSPAEDTADHSYAGQLNSLIVPPDTDRILAAVRSCWASVWEPAARAYAQAVHRGRSDEDGLVAVLVQRLVDAQTSGVLFTLNPMTGREEEMLVEAVWGLGGLLAEGRVTPDRSVVHLWDDELIERSLARKEVMLVPTARGAEERPVPPRDQGRPCLETHHLLELRDLGRRVQREMGYPQDIEWARSNGQFFIVQSRPITTLSFAPGTGQWTSANFREVMPGFASHLSQSQSFHHDFARSMDEVFARLKLRRPEDGNIQWSRTFFGHGYWNVGATKKMMARLPGYRERDFDRTVGIEPDYEGNGHVTGWGPRAIWQGIPTLLALNREYRRVLREAEQFCRWYDRREDRWDQVEPNQLDDSDLAAWTRFGLELHWRTNRQALLVSFLGTQAQDDFHRMVEKINRRAGRGQPISEARLLTGLTGMATARPLLELWQLSRKAVAEDQPARIILDTPVDRLADALRTERVGSAWWDDFTDFLQRYRYMAKVDEDLACPRWWEDPETPLAMLQRYVTDREAQDPYEKVERQRQVREREADRAVRLARGVLGRILPHTSSFERQYELVVRLCWWREETRIYLSRARYHTRRFLCEQGKRWVDIGILEQPDDIFWLSREEAIRLLAAELPPSVARDQVTRRRAVPELYRHFTPPLAISPGGLSSPGNERVGDGVLRGLGCSPGTVTARCCVVRSLDEANKLEAGRILVAPYANPGWTPLFQLAAGLVLEEGGLLSHSAVVAREYGLPAVLQVKDCTRSFRDGDLLRIDGLLGTVEKLR